VAGHSLPLLIFAQSARLLAQSAIQAGFTVWVSDCFLDTDTPGHRKCKLPQFRSANLTQIQQKLLLLTQSEPCYLVYGSGIELIPELLSKLPKNITLLGNDIESVNICNNPVAFFKLLIKLRLNFPDTFFEKPLHTDKSFLSKPLISIGGISIEVTQPNKHYVDNYYQQFIKGVSGSALFVSANNDFRALSFNKQLHSKDSFLLTGIEAPFILSDKNTQIVSSAISKLTEALQLKGLNSLDFIVDEYDNLFFLELNPRPSASMALIESDQCNPIKIHFDACQKGLLPNKQTFNSNHKGFYYFFPSKKVTINENIQWPNLCFDIPAAGTVIEQNNPVCSYLIQSDSSNRLQQLVSSYQSRLNELFD
jgi:predicted ATP-grasp superfamily ATP-dependent carboligase